MFKSSLCDHNDPYIRVNGILSVAALAAGGGKNYQKVIFKNCTPFTHHISQINNTLVDNSKDIDVVMPMYNLI